jgi:hypothetical protein
MCHWIATTTYEWPECRFGVVLKHRTCSGMRHFLERETCLHAQHVAFSLEIVDSTARRNGTDMEAVIGRSLHIAQKLEMRACQDGGPQLPHASTDISTLDICQDNSRLATT